MPKKTSKSPQVELIRRSKSRKSVSPEASPKSRRRSRRRSKASKSASPSASPKRSRRHRKSASKSASPSASTKRSRRRRKSASPSASPKRSRRRSRRQSKSPSTSPKKSRRRRKSASKSPSASPKKSRRRSSKRSMKCVARSSKRRSSKRRSSKCRSSKRRSSKRRSSRRRSSKRRSSRRRSRSRKCIPKSRRRSSRRYSRSSSSSRDMYYPSWTPPSYSVPASQLFWDITSAKDPKSAPPSEVQIEPVTTPISDALAKAEKISPSPSAPPPSAPPSEAIPLPPPPSAPPESDLMSEVTIKYDELVKASPTKDMIGKMVDAGALKKYVADKDKPLHEIGKTLRKNGLVSLGLRVAKGVKEGVALDMKIMAGLFTTGALAATGIWLAPDAAVSGATAIAGGAKYTVDLLMQAYETFSALAGQYSLGSLATSGTTVATGLGVAGAATYNLKAIAEDRTKFYETKVLEAENKIGMDYMQNPLII